MGKEQQEQMRNAGAWMGTYIGVMWIVSFICMANVSRVPTLSVLGAGIAIGSVIAIVVLIYQFRWRAQKGELSFGKSWLLVIQIFLYGSILLATGIIIYMKFFDHGAFGAYYEQLIENPETKLLLDQLLERNGIDSEEFVSQIVNISPINLAINFMESNILIGAFLSLPLALLSRIKFGLSIERNR